MSGDAPDAPGEVAFPRDITNVKDIPRKKSTDLTQEEEKGRPKLLVCQLYSVITLQVW